MAAVVLGAACSGAGDATVGGGGKMKVAAAGGVWRLPGGSTVEARPGSELRIRDGVVELFSGDVLVTGAARAGQSLIVDVGTARARLTGGGVTRARRSLGATIGTYRGVTRVGSGGAAVDVEALRQVSVPALGLLPSRTAPLELDGRDEWDRRLVGDAIELADQLVASSRGFAAQVAPGGADVADLVAIAFPSLQSAAAGAAGRTLADALVAASIAASGRRGSVAGRWADVLARRDEGAAWSVVARDQGVAAGSGAAARLDAAMARLDRYTIRARDEARAVQALAGSAGVAAPDPAPATVPPRPTVPGAAPPATVAPPPPVPAPGPEDTPPPSGLLDAAEPVVDTVGTLLGGLLGALA